MISRNYIICECPESHGTRKTLLTSDQVASNSSYQACGQIGVTQGEYKLLPRISRWPQIDSGESFLQDMHKLLARYPNGLGSAQPIVRILA